MSEQVTLYGPTYSAYTRTARLALAAKSVPYSFEEVDFSTGMPEAQRQRHPFAKVPAFRHGDFLLYETTAICRYIDEAFEGPALQPRDPHQRARMNQIVAVIDAYMSEPARMGLIGQFLFRPQVDQALTTTAWAQVAKSVQALAEICDCGSVLVGDAASLADFYLAPLFAYFEMFEPGRELIGTAPPLADWWRIFRDHPALAASKPPSGLTKR